MRFIVVQFLFIRNSYESYDKNKMSITNFGEIIVIYVISGCNHHLVRPLVCLYITSQKLHNRKDINFKQNQFRISSSNFIFNESWMHCLEGCQNCFIRLWPIGKNNSKSILNILHLFEQSEINMFFIKFTKIYLMWNKWYKRYL